MSYIYIFNSSINLSTWASDLENSCAFPIIPQKYYTIFVKDADRYCRGIVTHIYLIYILVLSKAFYHTTINWWNYQYLSLTLGGLKLVQIQGLPPLLSNMTCELWGLELGMWYACVFRSLHHFPLLLKTILIYLYLLFISPY